MQTCKRVEGRPAAAAAAAADADAVDTAAAGHTAAVEEAPMVWIAGTAGETQAFAAAVAFVIDTAAAAFVFDTAAAASTAAAAAAAGTFLYGDCALLH